MESYKSVSVEERFYLGLDLGKQSTFTALCILSPDPTYARRREVWELEADIEMETRKRRPELPVTDVKGERPPRPIFWVRHLERVPLNTHYRDVAKYVAAMLQTGKLAERTEICVDAGGVGNSVAEQLEDAGIYYFERVVITGARQETESGKYHRVPKVDLISAMEVAFQNREIKFPPRMPFAAELEEELENFQSRETAAGNTVFETAKAGAFDDLLLSMSLALRAGKHGEQVGPPPDESLVEPTSGPFRPLEDHELFTLEGFEF